MAEFSGDGHAVIVLEVLPALEGGGAQWSVLETAQAVVESGGSALVASAGGRMLARLARLGGAHRRVPLDTKNPLAIWRNAGRLSRLVVAEHVAIVHAHSRAPAWSALLAARRVGVPFVTTWHGTYEETLPFKRRYNSVMAMGDRVIAVSRFIAERIAARHPKAAARVVVIAPGVDPRRFDPEAVAIERVRKLAADWGIPADRPVIMLAARMTAWKGHRVLLAALPRMRTKDALCVFVGPLEEHGGYVSALRRAALEAGIADRVHFVGGCDDMPAAFLLADAVVNASTAPEAFGRVVIEAEAMARSVIATSHGAAAETIIPGETGWLVPPADPAALAQALDRVLMMSGEARRSVGRNARARVIASYSLRAMQDATLALYRDLLAR